MADDSASREFDLHVLSQLEKYFGKTKLQTLVAPPKGPGQSGPFDAAVLVKHIPSGKEAMCNKHHSQIRNKVACLLTLLLDTPPSL